MLKNILYNRTKANRGIEIICLVFIMLIFQQCSPEQPTNLFSGNRGNYMGELQGKSCHEKEYADWLGSHHDLAMEEANDSTVLGMKEFLISQMCWQLQTMEISLCLLI